MRREESSSLESVRKLKLHMRVHTYCTCGPRARIQPSNLLSHFDPKMLPLKKKFTVKCSWMLDAAFIGLVQSAELDNLLVNHVLIPSPTFRYGMRCCFKAHFQCICDPLSLSAHDFEIDLS